LVRYSIDGENWNAGNSLPSAFWKSVAASDDKFVAVSYSKIGAFSLDGENWIEVELPDGEYNAVAYGNGTWVAVGYRTAAAKSVDGINWTPSVLPEGSQWIDVVYGKGKFVAVSESDSSITNTAYSEDDGNTWQLSSFAGACKSITYGNNRFVVISGGFAGANESFISFNGINWVQGKLPEANWQSVSYGEGIFVAVAENVNFIATSQDGINWKKVNIGVPETYTSIVFNKQANTNNFYAAVSGSGSVLNLTIGARALGRIFLRNNRIQYVGFLIDKLSTTSVTHFIQAYGSFN
jgi:hypothetical protein